MTVVFTLVLSMILIYTFIFNDNDINIDTATVLSTLLAFFSIYLSATFYFKATEQSNSFYDRSYNHTKDIAESLSAMRGEFGKSLTTLEKHNDSLTQRFDSIKFGDFLEKKEELEQVKKESENTLREELKKMGIDSENQAKLLDLINGQEKSINNLKEEIYNLKSGNTMNKKVTVEYLMRDFIDKEIINSSLPLPYNNDVSNLFKVYIEKWPEEYREFLLDGGFINKKGGLTEKGITLLERVFAAIAERE